MADRFRVVGIAEVNETGLGEAPYPEEYIHAALLDYSTDPPTIVGLDGGEPEDQSLWRDWAWVADALNKLDRERRAETATLLAGADADALIITKAGTDLATALARAEKAEARVAALEEALRRERPISEHDGEKLHWRREGTYTAACRDAPHCYACHLRARIDAALEASHA